MRVLASILVLLFASLFATASLAQAALTECPNVDLTAPADGAVLDPSSRVKFTWDSEPRGTASREWISVKVDLEDASFTFENAKRKPAERGIYKGFARGTPGVYAWAVIFYDADGNPICQSEARTYFVTGTGFPDAPANFQPGGVAVVKTSLGRYVVKFNGSSYAGSFNRELGAGVDTYDDAADATGQFDWKALGYTGLDVHGNDQDNTIEGSDKGDNLYGYAGNDTIKGLDGDDHIEGGNESCSGDHCNLGGRLGDDIEGGNGKDTIKGGDESCSGKGCNALFGWVGDDIQGGDDDDTIHGGNESCTGKSCNLLGATADHIHGGAGNDTLNGNGGDDLMNGDAGNDEINGDAGHDVMAGGDGDDDITGGDGFDTADGDLFFDTGNDTCDAEFELLC